MSIATQTVKASLRQKGICQIPRDDSMISHVRRGFPYLSVSCPSVPAVLQRQSELQSSLTACRYPAGCKASACQERGSASQSGTAALLCKERETRYCDAIPWRWRLVTAARTYFAVDTKSLSSPPPSSRASSVLASPVDCRPITTHCRANRLVTISVKRARAVLEAK